MIIITVAALNFFLNVIGSFAYSTRIVGIITKRLTVSLSVANFLNLFSRLCSFMLIPILSKKIESELMTGFVYTTLPPHYLIILIAGAIGCAAAIFWFNSIISFVAQMVANYTANTNLLSLLLTTTFGPRTPLEPIKPLAYKLNRNDATYLFANTCITCVFTSATLAAIYSSYLAPNYRVTALSCAFLLNGIASFVFAVVIDPYVSLQTDDAVAGINPPEKFYYLVKIFLYSRLLGVTVSIFVFPIFAKAIVEIIKLI